MDQEARLEEINRRLFVPSSSSITYKCMYVFFVLLSHCGSSCEQTVADASMHAYHDIQNLYNTILMLAQQTYDFKEWPGPA